MCSITLRRWASALSVFLLIAVVAAPGQVTYYVDDDAAGDPGPGNPTVSDPLEDGTAAHPFDAIQKGIDAAVAGDTVLVLDGTYTGAGNKDLDYGGTDITVMSANGAASCIIDCEGSGRGFYLHSGETAAAVVDGFTITNGDAGSGGGGLYVASDPTIRNCVINGNTTSNDGGGVHFSYSNATILNCEIRGNSAGDACGGVNCDRGAPRIVNCMITGNTGNSDTGGVRCVNSNATLTNCTVADNAGSAGPGGALIMFVSNVTITNCIFAGNSGGEGPEISVRSTSIASVSYSDVYGGQTAVNVDSGCTLNWGDGMIDALPAFSNAAGGDYHLTAGSPCVDAGANNPPGVLPLTDFEGDARAIDGDGDVEPWSGVAETADMGADEFLDPTDVNMCFSPSGFAFSAPWGGPNPNDQTLSIWDCGAGTLNWQVIETCTWLSADPNSGDSTGENDQVALSADVAGLAPGQYFCQFQIVDPAAANNPKTIHVSLEVVPPEICLSASDFTFIAPEGGPTPDDQTLSIWPCSAGTLNWQIIEGCTWLTVDPNNGSSTGETDDVALGVNVAGLPTGAYNCTLEVVDPLASNSPQSVDVTLYVSGVTRHVPSEYATIQAAIDAALPGDTVVVADGTYTGVGNRGIDFLGKDIVVRSENGAPNCVIDCQQADRGFHFQNGETNAARLEGFRIKNGLAVRGGGIRCISSSPTIVSCIIVSNDTSGSLFPYNNGGGVHCESSAAVLLDCVISGNDTSNGQSEYYTGTDGGFGGGIYCAASSLTIVGCGIHNNSTGNGGHTGAMSGHSGDGGSGAGICCNNCSLTLVNCIIGGNVTGVGGDAPGGGDSGDGGDGAGLCVLGPSVVDVANCRFSGNRVGAGGDYYGHAGYGGGVFVESEASIAVVNCTVTENIGYGAAGLYNVGLASVANSIFWDEAGTEISGTVAVTYSDVEGGWTGVGNIDADPLLSDSYQLTASSPCIDAGDNLQVPPDVYDIDDDGDVDEPLPLDLDLNSRFVDIPWIADSGAGSPPLVDMGAYEEYQCFGDLNGDGAIDLSDLAALLSNYGVAVGASYTDGDMDGDGDVDLSDLAALLGVYGTSCYADPPMLLVCSKATDQVLGYDLATGGFIREIVGPASGLDFPNGIARDGAGYLYVSSVAADSVKKCSLQSGDVVLEYTGGGLDGPDGVLLTGSSLLVSSFATNSVKEFDLQTGAWIRDLVAAGSGGLDAPAGLALAANGNLLVASQHTDQVLEYDEVTGAFVGIAAAGVGLNTPEGLLPHPSGDLLVASFYGHSVLRFASDGSYLGEFVAGGSGGLNGAYALAWVNGDLVVSSYFTDEVLKYSASDGSFLGVFASGAGLDEPTHMIPSQP